MSTYWPWWAGALALGSIAVAHARFMGQPMGVSSSFGKVAHPVREIAVDRTTTDERRAPVAAHVAFLAMLAVGALVASLVRGGFHVRASLGQAHEHLFGAGVPMVAGLLFGGALVGAGTRMSGGCTSGHGLSGCARLAPRSLIATGTFLGVAIATALVLQQVLS